MAFEFEFELPENPTGTAQQKGVSTAGGRVRFYTKDKVMKTRRMYAVAIRDCFRRLGVPIPHFDGAVGARIVFTFAVKNKRLWGAYKPTVPDADNVVKLLLDVLTADLHFWRDDAQVAILEVTKLYGEKSTVHIILEELKND